MFDYGEMQSLAQELLTEFGQGKIELTTYTPGGGPAYNPGPSTETAKQAVPGTVQGVWQKYVDKGYAVGSDKLVIIPAGLVVPAMEGNVYVDDIPHKIVKVLRLPDAGTIVTYHVIARK